MTRKLQLGGLIAMFAWFILVELATPVSTQAQTLKLPQVRAVSLKFAQHETDKEVAPGTVGLCWLTNTETKAPGCIAMIGLEILEIIEWNPVSGVFVGQTIVYREKHKICAQWFARKSSVVCL